MAIEIKNKCIKMNLPNNKYVDILPEVFNQISNWIQENKDDPESGGFILGYEHADTGNISLECVTTPQKLDIRDRINFKIRDPKHKALLRKGEKRKSYYMGVWHTHPQIIPSPSSIDLKDWRDSLLIDKTACRYIFFMIAGTKGIRLWIGDFNTKKIEEIFECEKEGNLYKNI